MINPHNHTKDRTEGLFSDREKRIYSFLYENPIGILSTVTPDGDPHGAVIYFVINQDFTIWFLTKNRTRKYDNLIHDDHVMLTVYEPLTQAIVQVSGIAEEIKSADQAEEVSQAIMRISMQTSESGLPPIAKLDAGSYTAIRIVPVRIRMAVYARPDAGHYDDLFESIESFDLSKE